MLRKETKKEKLLRRLEENREFYYACGRMSHASFLEELAEYIERTQHIDEDKEKQFLEVSHKMGW